MKVYYEFFRVSSDTIAFDIDGDKKSEIVYAYVSEDGHLYYIIHRYKTIEEKTIQFEKYDLISFQKSENSLYLVCEHKDKDLNSYYYKVDYDGENLIFTQEKTR